MRPDDVYMCPKVNELNQANEKIRELEEKVDYYKRRAIDNTNGSGGNLMHIVHGVLEYGDKSIGIFVNGDQVGSFDYSEVKKATQALIDRGRKCGVIEDKQPEEGEILPHSGLASRMSHPSRLGMLWAIAVDCTPEPDRMDGKPRRIRLYNEMREWYLDKHRDKACPLMAKEDQPKLVVWVRSAYEDNNSYYVPCSEAGAPYSEDVDSIRLEAWQKIRGIEVRVWQEPEKCPECGKPTDTQ